MNNPIDRFGTLKAQIASMKDEESLLRDEIVAMGAGAHDGMLFRATVSETVRETEADVRDHPLVAAYIAELLESGDISKQWLVAHRKQTPITTVRCVARKS